jgi:hypothetical protein
MKTISTIMFLFFCINVFGQQTKNSVTEIVFDHSFKRGNIDFAKPTTIHIDVKNDTIWRYVKQDDKQIGDFYRIEKSGKIYYHAKIDKRIIYREYDLFNSKDKHSVSENQNDTKVISGYLCHKVHIESKQIDDEEMGFITLYDMYVTKEINLPVHSLLNIGENLKDYFPLEITITTLAFDAPKEFFKVKFIK